MTAQWDPNGGTTFHDIPDGTNFYPGLASGHRLHGQQ